MLFEWGIQKSVLNYWKHGIRFADVVDLFHNPAVFIDVTREEDEEVRIMIIGSMADTATTVAFTLRSGNVRIISARKSSRRERETLEQFLQNEADT